MSDEVMEQSLDEVAASLLVKPVDTKTPVKAEVKAEVKADVEETPAVEEPNGTENEVVADEKTPDAEPDDTQTDDEEDVDADEFEIDVVVDGTEQKVKLKDLKANYSGNSAIEKRLQEVTEVKAQAVKHTQQLYAALTEQATRLVKLDEVLTKVAEPEEINWEELKRTNLPKYLLERDKQREAQEKRAHLKAEADKLNAAREAIQAKALEEYTMNEAKALVSKIPELGDPVKSTETFNRLAKAAEAYGYSTEEVGGVLDHRAMLVLRDAQRYQELMAKQKAVAAKPAIATALLRPSAARSSSGNSARKLQEALVKKARSTGKVDDIAAMLMVKKK
jgi:hypothetical protein